MKEIVIQIPPQKEALVRQLIKELGGNVLQKQLPNHTKMEKASGHTNEDEKVSPTFLFGKWKNLNINPKHLRETAWDRSNKSL